MNCLQQGLSVAEEDVRIILRPLCPENVLQIKIQIRKI